MEFVALKECDFQSTEAQTKKSRTPRGHLITTHRGGGGNLIASFDFMVHVRVALIPHGMIMAETSLDAFKAKDT